MKCNGCLQTLSAHHVLIYIKRVLVILLHNEIRDKIIHLSIQAFFPHYVYIKALIQQSHNISEGDMRHRRVILETWGDVLIRGLW